MEIKSAYHLAPVRQFGFLLWCGVSLVALSSIAKSETTGSIHKVEKAADGKSSRIKWNGSASNATAGENAKSIQEIVSHSIVGVAGSAIELGSRGGQGGNGIFRSTLPNTWGEKGGAGGDVSLALASQAISTVPSTSNPAPAIWLYSMGGDGGNGFQNSNRQRGLGAGGAGGNVSFETVSNAQEGQTQTEISTEGSQSPGIYLLSKGGDSGAADLFSTVGGTYPARAKDEAGGNGGSVNFAFGESGVLTQQQGEAGAVRYAYRTSGTTYDLGDGWLQRPWQISTTGDNAAAIILSSRGGKGAVAQYDKWGLFNNYSGTNAGDGGNVTGANYGTLQTYGDSSYGMLLQSVGGAGGRGASEGVKGAAGGKGGAVSAINDGSIFTQGAQAAGILAQSVGGTGGDGKGALWLNGGDGGAAGAGGSVSVSQGADGTINTQGTAAPGIVAQSVGGGYSADAYVMVADQNSGSAGGAGGASGFLPFGSAGKGGMGGDGNKVTVDFSGGISTAGASSPGILEQSVGGGGGAGGRTLSTSVIFNIALGAGGGSAGKGGDVTFTGNSNGSIQTINDNSAAVVVQSVGGGGGIGGSVSAYTVSPVVSIALAMGGDGGGGGDGGAILANNASSLQTFGQYSDGLSAQSIGGGGGTAGAANSVGVALPSPVPNAPTPAVSIGVTLGGSGGSGGLGGAANVTNSGSIVTSGEGSRAISVSSIGGGGGDGGAAWSYLGAFPSVSQKALTIGLTLGGSGGGGGNSSDVRAVNETSGEIRTQGTGAQGISAMSIGGGGGTSGDVTTIGNLGSFQGNIGLTVALGGKGGNGGSGGGVSVTNDGSIETSGDFSGGILASSIGGGGGASSLVDTTTKVGLTLPKSIEGVTKKAVDVLSLADSITVNASLGGSGGNGGVGQSVSVFNTGLIDTQGANSEGILAQSVGGGGGSAKGFLGGGAGTISGNLTIGGSGGKGGSGGSVTVVNEPGGKIVTQLAGSAGILAQSIGGGGGNGGGYAKTNTSIWDENTFTFVTNLIREAYQSGDFASKNTDLKDYSSIKTAMARAKALTSILDSMNVIMDKNASIVEKISKSTFFVGLAALQLTYRDKLKEFNDTLKEGASKAPIDGNLTVSIGGSGGDGGVGESAVVNNRSSIFTSGSTASPGIEAQSIGGGGGIGGAAFSDGINKLNVTVSVGGNGGKGGKGGRVTVENSGQIKTVGDFSSGVLAQSIGGGGGVGGSATSSQKAVSLSGHVNIGGTGGASSNGGVVKVSNSGGIVTYGQQSDGIIAQSIGGGGGYSFLNGTSDRSLATSEAPKEDEDVYDAFLQALSSFLERLGISNDQSNVPTDATGNIEKSILKLDVSGNLGSSGSAGGNGKITIVKVDHGSIDTNGDDSAGILAQSVGGGGGAGGFVIADQASWWQRLGSFSLGSSGLRGTGGNGSSVRVSLVNNAVITTRGMRSTGILAQSIGAGGGTTDWEHFTDFTSRLGASNASRGRGGVVRVSLSQSQINTFGDQSFGILAQSIGGGGGNASFDMSTLAGAAGYISNLNVELGGSGTSSGDSGAVDLSLVGSEVTTEGYGAVGIVAQSIGGGGGSASIYYGNGVGSGSPTYLLGGDSGQPYGDGNSVSVSLSKDTLVSTKGNSSDAFLLQSIGGGGGLFDLDAAASAAGSFVQVSQQFGSAAVTGNGGDITFNVADDSLVRISTTGEKSDGIFAQTLGGGGGIFVGFADRTGDGKSGSNRNVSGTGGDISVSLANAIVTATGKDAYGVYLQSGVQNRSGAVSARGNNGRISLTTNGIIAGGSGNGAAIRFDGGTTANTIEIGADGVIRAASGSAIYAPSSFVNVSNSGLIAGNYASAGGTFTNDGIYQSLVNGTISFSGGGAVMGSFINRGTLDIGGVGQIGTLKISGGTTELAGKMLVDVSSNSALTQHSDQLQADRLVVNGMTVVPNVIGDLLKGSFTIAKAHDVNVQSAIQTAGEAGPISWSVETQRVNAGAGQVVLTPHADFLKSLDVPATRTERALLNSLQNAWSRQNSDMAPIFGAMANITSSQEYARTVESLTATENVAQSAVLQTLGAAESLDASMTCPSFEGKSSLIREGECLWLRQGGARVEQLSGGNSDPFKASAVETRVGGQKQISPHWFIGGTAGEKTSWLSATDGLTSSNGQSVDIALSARRQMGPFQLAAALHGGYGWFNVRNTFLTEDALWRTTNRTSTWTGGARFRAAYQFVFGNWYVMPRVDFDVVYSAMPGYSLMNEQNELNARAMHQWTEFNEPELEAGARVPLGKTDWLRLWVNVGGNFIVGNGLTQRVSYSHPGQSGISFMSTAGIPSTMLDVGTGVQFVKTDKYELMGTGKAQISDHFMTQQGTLRFNYHF